MGRLIVIEGLDGAGKRTLADGLVAALGSRRLTVARQAFPRYGEDVHADLVSEALHGRHGDLVDSVYGMAVLYALDRAGASGWIRAALEVNDVVLLDRYVASNAAYQAARCHQGADGEVVTWVRELEIDRLGLPLPDAQLLLRVPAGLAAGRARKRERTEAGRDRDAFESDSGLQERCAVVYEELAAAGWLAPWLVLDGRSELDFAALATALLDQV
ncbi:MAG: dTMP kinase [Sciscionella sp.]